MGRLLGKSGVCIKNTHKNVTHPNEARIDRLLRVVVAIAIIVYVSVYLSAGDG